MLNKLADIIKELKRKETWLARHYNETNYTRLQDIRYIRIQLEELLKEGTNNG